MALKDDIISYWKLDESSGNADDAVSTHDLTNANVTYNTGKINNGAVFNGSSAYFTASNNNWLPTTAFTISLWFKTSTSNADRDLFISDQSFTTYTIRILNGGYLFWRIIPLNNATTGNASIQVNTNYADGNWKHLVATWDGSNMKLYLNASQVGSTTAMSTTPVKFNTDDVEIGRYPSGVEYFNGSLDEVGIWSRALSSTEVTALYNSGNGLQYPFVTNLTLAVDTMALTLTYASVTLTKAIKLVVDTMALSFTFADVMFNNALTLIVDTMALSLTYADVTLKKAVKLVVDTMSLVLSFKDVVLRKIGWDYDTKPTSSWTNDDK